MPRYEIDHSIPLSAPQQDELAQEITRLHLASFPLVPKFFVNIIFTDISYKPTYLAGKKRKTNHIKGHLRLGNRNSSEFQKLAEDIEQAWIRIVVDRAENNRLDHAVQTVILSPANNVGIEAGFPLPLAGKEQAWYNEHAAKFEHYASEGDDEMREMVKDLKEKFQG